MKKFIALILTALSFQASATVSIAGNVSAYIPTNSLVKDIYSSTWLDLGVRFDHMYLFGEKVPVTIFAEVDYIYSHGQSIGGNQSTKIELVPLTLGLKWMQKINDWSEFYIGVAPKYFFMTIKNDSDYVPSRQSTGQLGAYGTVGFDFYLWKGLFIDLFGSYSYVNFNAPSSGAGYETYGNNLSGFNVGGDLVTSSK